MCLSKVQYNPKYNINASPRQSNMIKMMYNYALNIFLLVISIYCVYCLYFGG